MQPFETIDERVTKRKDDSDALEIDAEPLLVKCQNRHA